MEYSPTWSNNSCSLSPLRYSPETSSAAVVSQSDEEPILAATHPKKRAGRKKVKETRHPVYRGVRHRNLDKWVCELRDPTNQKRIWLGTYPTPEMAARAHDVAALALRGNAACLNFADSVWRLPVPVSRDAKDLRKAAAEAAEAFRPSGGEEIYREEEREDEAAFGPLYDVVYDDMSMAAEGVLMSPPPCLGRIFNWDDVECDADFALWNF